MSPRRISAKPLVVLLCGGLCALVTASDGVAPAPSAVPMATLNAPVDRTAPAFAPGASMDWSMAALPPEPVAVEVSWPAATDDRELAGYLVHIDGVFARWVPVEGPRRYRLEVPTPYRALWEVRAQDRAGNNSAPIELVVGDGPSVAPAAPKLVDAWFAPSDGAVHITVTRPSGPARLTVLTERDAMVIDRREFAGGAGPANFEIVDRPERIGLLRYELRTQDLTRATSDALVVELDTADTTPPSAPPAAQLDLDRPRRGVARLSWLASSDDQRVRGYLVHLDGRFLVFLPAGGPTMVHEFELDPAALAADQVIVEVRAQDPVGNNSLPAVAVAMV